MPWENHPLGHIMLSTNSNSSPRHFITSDRTSAGILFVSSFLIIFAMLHHPHGQGETLEELKTHMHSQQVLNQWVHGGAIALLALSFAAFSCLFTRLGHDRILNRLAILSFALGTIAMTAAATISGFIAPSLISRIHQPSEVETQTISWILAALRDGNRAFDEIGVASYSLGIGLFAICLLTKSNRNRVIGSLGLFLSITALAGLWTGHTGATIAGIQNFAYLYATWSIACGVALIRGRLNHDANS